jgi:hypothetical protein
MRLHKEKVMVLSGMYVNVIMDKGPGRDSFDIVPFIPRKLWEMGLGDLGPIWKAARELMNEPDGAIRMLDNGINIYSSSLFLKKEAA